MTNKNNVKFYQRNRVRTHLFGGAFFKGKEISFRVSYKKFCV